MTRWAWTLAWGPLLWGWLAAALAGGVTVPAWAVTPQFVPTRCGFWIPPHERATCGFLVVAERHDQARSRPIQLFVAVFRSTSRRPAADPVIFVNGGPGDPGFVDDAAEAWWADSAPFRERRDFIVFDQRGVGRSRPALDCPELNRLAETARAMPDEARRTAEVAAVLACRDRLTASGVDLAAYTTTQSAADIIDLATALRLRRFNLFGLSYGTRLALAVMRRAPQQVRSAVLDGVYPPGVHDRAERPWLIARTFQQLFIDCAANPACAARFPELRQRFEAHVANLNAAPVAVEHPAGLPVPPTVVDGTTLVEALFGAFQQTAMIPELPMMIAEATDGDYRRVAPWLGLLAATDSASAVAMALSVECSENPPLVDLGALADRAAAFAPYGSAATRTLEERVCPLWDVARIAPEEQQPVMAAVPTLLLAGAYDPVTPPEWARAAAAGLPRAAVLEFTAASHGITLSEECATAAAAAFVDDPTRVVANYCPSRAEPPRFVVE